MEYGFLGKNPGDMSFAARNVAKMETEHAVLYRRAIMAKKAGKEKYSFLLFSVGEIGREIFNTWIWPKVVDGKGEPTDEDKITVVQDIR